MNFGLMKNDPMNFGLMEKVPVSSKACIPPVPMTNAEDVEPNTIFGLCVTHPPTDIELSEDLDSPAMTVLVPITLAFDAEDPAIDG